jgi:hypothetical protein
MASPRHTFRRGEKSPLYRDLIEEKYSGTDFREFVAKAHILKKQKSSIQGLYIGNLSFLKYFLKKTDFREFVGKLADFGASKRLNQLATQAKKKVPFVVEFVAKLADFGASKRLNLLATQAKKGVVSVCQLN